MEEVDSFLELSRQSREKSSSDWNLLEDSLKKLSHNLNEKKTQLASKEEQLEEKDSYLKRFEEELNACVEEKRTELQDIERLLQISLRDFVKHTELCNDIKAETSSEETKLERLREKISESSAKLVSLERSVGEKSAEAESKEREVVSVQRRLRNLETVFEATNRDVAEVQRKLDEKSGEVERREASIAEIDREIVARERRLAASREELERFKKKTDSLSASRQATENFLEGCSLEIRAMQKRVENVAAEIDKLDSKFEEVNAAALKSAEEVLVELETQGKSFASLKLVEKETELKGFGSRVKVIKIEPEQTSSRAICGANNACSDYVHKLIRRGDIILAVEVIKEMKLTDEFSPIALLSKSLDESRNFTEMIRSEGHITEEAKIMAMNKELAIARAFEICAKENGREIGMEELEKRIGFLEDYLTRPISDQSLKTPQLKLTSPMSTSGGVSIKASRLSKRQRSFLE